MANKTIGGLNALAGSLSGAFFVEVEDESGNSVKVSLATMKTFVNTDPTVAPSSEPWRGARVRFSTGWTYTSNSVSLVAWDAADVDTDSIWSGGAPTRLTVPTGVTKVILRANLRLPSGGSTCHISLLKNGAVVDGMFSTRVTAPANGDLNGTSAVLSVTGGDYFEVQLISNSGQSMAVDARNWFEMSIVEAV